MSVKYATPLHLDLKSSRLFVVFIALVLLTATLSIYLLPADLMLKFLLLLCTVLMAIKAFRDDDKIRHLVWQDGRHWLLHSSEQTHEAVMMDQLYAISWLVILRFRLDTGARAYKIICYDALDAEAFRRLKVRLKVEAMKNIQHAKMET